MTVPWTLQTPLLLPRRTQQEPDGRVVCQGRP